MATLDSTLDKLPPQNLEAEQSVLGAILLDNTALHKALEIIEEGDFYRSAHRKIFGAMIDLFNRNEAIDIITLSDILKQKNQLEEVGGVSYLSTLVNTVPTSANIRHHCRIIREKSLLRNLINSVTEIAGMVYEEGMPADDLVDVAEKKIFEISDKRIRASFSQMKDVIKESFEMIEQLYSRKEAITGIPTGFRDLDELTTGFQRGDLIIIGGRPSMGKTTFALNIAQHVAVELKEPVAIFSLEMSTRQLALRMLCAEAMIDSNKVRKGFISKEDIHKLTSAAGRLAEAPIFIDESTDISVLEMRAKARRLKMEHGLGLLIVDYLQLMKGRGMFERREQEISDISRSLKALAKELDIPVIALSQLNRGVEQRHDKRPTLADLRESGAIEQDADLIIFLYREEFYNQKSLEAKGVAEVIVAKQRNGPTDTVKLTFLADSTRFVDSTTYSLDVEEEVF
ncbi:MAG: replicative DNA helicase [Nitrospirae bacterium]|nr:MAG: replicative DNA helicase [Nitrospirota bacterium]